MCTPSGESPAEIRDFANSVGNKLLYKEERKDSKYVEKCQSGRNVLIDMLQQEIVKKEKLYIDLIDEYEKLRYRHCTIVQEYSNLKQVYQKLEEDADTNRRSEKNCTQKVRSTLKRDLENWKEQYKNASNDMKQKIDDIENILQNRNFSCAEVMSIYLSQLRSLNIRENNIGSNKQTETSCSDQCELEELRQSNATLAATIDKLKSENERITTNLKDKQKSLENCICVLEKNQNDIEHLSDNIDFIIKEKDKYCNEVSRLKLEIEESRLSMTQTTNEFEKTDSETFTEELKIKNAYSLCEFQPKSFNFARMKQIINSYRVISNNFQKEIEMIDSGNCVCTCNLAILITNLDANTDLLYGTIFSKYTTNEKETLAVNNDDNDIIANNLRIELADCKLKLQQFEQKPDIANDETQTDDQQTKSANRPKTPAGKVRKSLVPVRCGKMRVPTTPNRTENKKKCCMKCCQTDVQMSCIVKDLETAQLKVAEYEEENKGYLQRIDILMEEIRNLQEEKEQVKQLCNESSCRIKLMEQEYCEEAGKKDELIKSLQEDLCISKQLQESCKHCDTKEEIIRRVSLTDPSSPPQHVSIACEDLECIHEQLRKDFYEKIEMNLKIQNQEQIIAQFQGQFNSECTYDNLQVTIAELTSELGQKQCLICHLEDCVDRSSDMLNECEAEIKSLTCHNERLKNQLEEFNICKTELEEYKQKSFDFEEAIRKQLEEQDSISNKIILLNEEYNRLQNVVEQKDRKLEELMQENERLQNISVEMFDTSTQCIGDVSASQNQTSAVLLDKHVIISPTEDVSTHIDRPSKMPMKGSFLSYCQDSWECDSKDIFKTASQITTFLTSISTAAKFNREKKLSEPIIVQNYINKLSSSSSEPCLSNCYCKTNSFHIAATLKNKNTNEFYDLNHLEEQLRRQEQSIKNLQNDKVALIVQLNSLHQAVQSLVRDNNNLKNGVGVLLNDVIGKLQKLSSNDDDSSSVESLTQEILKSLTDMKGALVDKYCSCCPNKGCNCMRIINSKYVKAESSKQIKSLYIRSNSDFTSTDYVTEKDFT